jgi:hypothetical protein
MFFDPAIVATLHLNEKPKQHNDDKRNNGKLAEAASFTLLPSKPKLLHPSPKS